MKNLVKLSIFAIALGFFASCGDDKPATDAPAPAATETPAAPATPATTTSADTTKTTTTTTTSSVTATDSTKK